jgi:hypothetical protein
MRRGIPYRRARGTFRDWDATHASRRIASMGQCEVQIQVEELEMPFKVSMPVRSLTFILLSAQLLKCLINEVVVTRMAGFKNIGKALQAGPNTRSAARDLGCSLSGH